MAEETAGSSTPEILVRGVGEAGALPDRALLQVVVEGEGGSQEVAYAEAAKSVRAIDAVLDRFSDAIDKRTTTALTVLPKTRWRRGESVRTGYRGTRATVLEVTDLSKLGALMAELAAGNPSAISGPSWHIDPANEVHDAVRKQAVEDGRRRATSYANALGLRIKGIAWVAEPGLRHGTQESGPLGRLSAAAGPMRALAEEPIEIGVEEIRVRAAVEIAFETEPASR